MAEKTFQSKDIIFREGDPSDTAYVIKEGKVEILKGGQHGEVPLATLETGAVFGEMSLIDGRSSRSATARAVDKTVVDLINKDELEKLISQCPPRLVPIISSAFDRLRVTNQRLSENTQAAIRLDTHINKITITPVSEKLKDKLKPIEVMVARLPFKIGGYHVEGEPNRYDQNNLYIPSEGPPLAVSRNHCAIELEDDGQVYLVDRGSRFGSEVNTKRVGRGRGVYKWGLKEGENELILGPKSSGYVLKLVCE